MISLLFCVHPLTQIKFFLVFDFYMYQYQYFYCHNIQLKGGEASCRVQKTTKLDAWRLR